jgi:hypothetical protein
MKHDIVVYYITGRQIGPLSIPHTWCEECDVTVRTVRSVIEEVDPDQTLTFAAKPWLRHAVPALAIGAWHPPVVVIEGVIFSQGLVPDEFALRDRISTILANRPFRFGGGAKERDAVAS